MKKVRLNSKETRVSGVKALIKNVKLDQIMSSLLYYEVIVVLRLKLEPKLLDPSLLRLSLIF